jgi:hypothetical protein
MMTQREFYELFGETWGSGGIEEEVTFVNPHLAWMKYWQDPEEFMNQYGKYARRPDHVR